MSQKHYELNIYNNSQLICNEACYCNWCSSQTVGPSRKYKI